MLLSKRSYGHGFSFWAFVTLFYVVVVVATPPVVVVFLPAILVRRRRAGRVVLAPATQWVFFQWIRCFGANQDMVGYWGGSSCGRGGGLLVLSWGGGRWGRWDGVVVVSFWDADVVLDQVPPMCGWCHVCFWFPYTWFSDHF
jgi:hypothetical protein